MCSESQSVFQISKNVFFDPKVDIDATVKVVVSQTKSAQVFSYLSVFWLKLRFDSNNKTLLLQIIM